MSARTFAPTPAAAWPFIAQAKATVFDAMKRPADAILMYPDRWAWFEAGVDGQNRPLVLPAEAGPWNAAGLIDSQLVNAPKPVGRGMGLPVYTATGIPKNLGLGTNQTRSSCCPPRT